MRIINYIYRDITIHRRCYKGDLGEYILSNFINSMSINREVMEYVNEEDNERDNERDKITTNTSNNTKNNITTVTMYNYELLLESHRLDKISLLSFIYRKFLAHVLIN